MNNSEKTLSSFVLESKKIFYNQIIHGDCIEEIKNIPKESVDLIATDPPYEINYENCDWDKKGIIDWEKLTKGYNRVLKPNGNLIIFQGWSEIFKIKQILDKYFSLRNWIIYDRIKGRGTKRNLVSTREDILWYSKGDNYTYNKISSKIKKKTGGTIGKKNGNEYRAMSNVWTDISPIVPWSSEREKHPTQKPMGLMERIIKIFSNENDIVLDSFCGSGTTCVASKNLKRKYIGIEKNKNFYEIVLKRLSNE